MRIDVATSRLAPFASQGAFNSATLRIEYRSVSPSGVFAPLENSRRDIRATQPRHTFQRKEAALAGGLSLSAWDGR